jgi:homoserine/homoserine lactone efflux protein
VLRFVSAIYLIYLGIRAITGSFRRSVAGDDELNGMPPAHGSLLLQGVLIQVTNPKALLFVSALLPQFINPNYAIPMQLAIMVLTTVTVDAIVLAAYALLAQRGSRSLRSSRWGTAFESAFGAAMVFFGLRLLVGRR